MPIHEYRCKSCNNVFEVLHTMNEDCTAVCPKCMKPAAKLISASTFVLKGSGFYVNDYPSKSRKDAEKAEKEPSDKVAQLKNGGKKAENAVKNDSGK